MTAECNSGMEESGAHSVLPSAQSIVLSLRYPFAKCSIQREEFLINFQYYLLDKKRKFFKFKSVERKLVHEIISVD